MKVPTPMRLSPATLPRVPSTIRAPRYDRTALKPSIVHLGVGAFHRCHQAEYLEDLAEIETGVALMGVSLYPPEIEPALGPQDGLYSRTLAYGNNRETRIIGVLRKVYDYSRHPGEARSLIARPGVNTITMTITEKGYCHVPATGRLDPSHPGILKDIAGQLATPVTAPGFLVAGLAERRAARAGAINLISCDNIAGNGVVLREVVKALAREVDRDLADWIDANVAFPSTMVDRIVPASTDEDNASVTEALGLVDRAAVLGEPFRQWVIEDLFFASRPEWERVGVEIVKDVMPYEHIKMRVLNAAQTILALLGALNNNTYTADAIREPALAMFTSETLLRETLPHLPVVENMEARRYLLKSLDRISNSALRHTCHQISTDTSQKIRQRVIEPLRLRRSRGLDAPGLETAIAAWVAYLACSQKEFGQRWVAADPIATDAAAVAEAVGGDLLAFARGIVALDRVFGEDLAADTGFAERIANRTRDLLKGTSPSTVAGYLA